MPDFTIWPLFGFTDNPYDQATLPADDLGSRLLAGRETVIPRVQRSIGSGGSIPSFEGPVGAGKTSLLNVAVYGMYRACLAEADGSLWLPADELMEPNPDGEAFEAEAYRIALRTIIKHHGAFFACGLPEPKIGSLKKWLLSPSYSSWSIGLNLVAVGLSGGRGSEPNVSEGFTKSGFKSAIQAVLNECFSSNRGGIVFVLDNLEIVGQVGEARRQLDALRDGVLTAKGLRWVLCGSRGIVSRARTQRLAGVIRPPISVPPLGEDAVVEAVRLRIEEFGGETATAPLEPENFRYLYRVLHENLRDSMTWAQDFSDWLYESHGPSARDWPMARDQLLSAWLDDRAAQANAAAGQIQRRAWAFFEDLCARGGRAGSSEFVDVYGFEHQQQGVNAVTQLAGANLIQRESDPEDGTRTINTVTAEGWLVWHHRRTGALPNAPA